MPSLQNPILALLLIIFSTILFLYASADDGRMLQSTAPGNIGGGKLTSAVPTKKKGGGGMRKKGHHGKMVSEFLNAHNEVRAKYKEPPLRWNQTLEKYAQQWAAMRAQDCKLIHAPNNSYGENLFWGKYRHWTPREVVKQWADEVAFYDSRNHHCAEGQQCGHYTQIVWRSSAWVGCAKQICFNGEVFVVCEYFPAGNYIDTPDPFTAKTSYPGEEYHIPQTTGPTLTAAAATTPQNSAASKIGTTSSKTKSKSNGTFSSSQKSPTAKGSPPGTSN